MGSLGEKLSGFYKAIEDKWYDFLDFLQSKNIPVYKTLIEPIESRGIPSLPVYALIFVLLVGAIGFVAFGGLNPSQRTFRVSVYGGGEALNGATVMIMNDKGEIVATNSTVEGSVIFENVAAGGVLTVKASKEGYEDAEKNVDTTTRDFVRIDLQSVQVIEPTPEPAVSEEDWTDPSQNPEAESLEGRLIVVLRSTGDNAVVGNATVRVYNSRSSTLIAEESVVGVGSVTIEHLEVDTEVVVKAEANGYLPYDGASKPITIRPGTNNALVSMTRISGDTQGASTVRLSVMENGKPIAGATIKVYVLGGTTPLLTGTTNNDGFYSANVSGDATSQYYASATKTGYFVSYSDIFNPPAAQNIYMIQITADTAASLSVHVTDEEDGKAVSAASVIVFGYFPNPSGTTPWPISDTATTNSNGSVSFVVPRSKPILVNVSKGNRVGSAEKTLDASANQSIDVVLALNNATLIASARDMIANVSMGATFNAYYNGTLLSSCASAPNGNCTLAVKARRPITLNASASGYETRTTELTPITNEYRYVEVSLISSAALNDSVLAFDGLYAASNGQKISSAMLGHVYYAQYYFASHNANMSGVFERIGNDTASSHVAAVTSHFPPAGNIYSSTSFSATPQNGTCSPSRKCDWIDAQYYGDRLQLMKFNVTIDTDAPTDPITRMTQLRINDRSYITRLTSYIRNPFDDVLGVAASTPLPSGFNAKTFSRNFDVLTESTTCQNGICLTLHFCQSGKCGPDYGFNATSMLNMEPGDEGYAQLEIAYKVELYTDAASAMTLSFNADPLYLYVTNVSVPIQGYAIVNGKAQVPGGAKGPLVCNVPNASKVTINSNAFTLDLSAITGCSDYVPYSQSGRAYSFTGVIFAKPKTPTNRTDVTSNYTIGSNSSRHETWMAIQNNNGAYSEYADVEATLSQPNNTQPQNANPYEAVYTGDCSDMQLQNGTCHHGLVKIMFQAIAQRGREQNSISLETNPSHLRVISAELRKEGTQMLPGPTVYEGGFSYDVGAMQQGDQVTGTAYAVAVGQDVYSQLKVRYTAYDTGPHTTEFDKNVFVRLIPTPAGTNMTSYFDPSLDNCRGRILINFHPEYTAGYRLTLGDNCTDLAMRVTPVFPADAVTTQLNGGGASLQYQVVTDDGSSGCYESCNADGTGCQTGFKSLITNGEKTLRYNSELATCPTKFRARGNDVMYSSVKVKISITGPNTESRNITIRVLPDLTHRSLFVYPVETAYYSSYKGQWTEGIGNKASLTDYRIFGPRLFAVSNRKNFGQRTIVFAEGNASGEVTFSGLNDIAYVSFDGPGTKTVAVFPQPGKRLIVFEKLPNTQGEVIYVSDKPDMSYVTDVAEYDEMRAESECPRKTMGGGQTVEVGTQSDCESANPKSDDWPWLNYADCTRSAWAKYADEVSKTCVPQTPAGDWIANGATSAYGFKECAEDQRVAWASDVGKCKKPLAQALGSPAEENCNCYATIVNQYRTQLASLRNELDGCIAKKGGDECKRNYVDRLEEIGGDLKKGYIDCKTPIQDQCFSDETGWIVEKKAWNVGNLPFKKDAIQRLIDEGRTVANETVFWRSNQVSMWCDTGCDEADRKPGNWLCCRPSIDDWRNVTNTTLYEQHACTFCNNSYHPNGADREWDCNDPLYPSTFVGCTYNDQIPLLQCDQRCTKTGDFGSSQVNYGEYFVANLSQCLVQLTPTRVYDGSAPMPSISQADVQSCISAHTSSERWQCGLELQGSTPLCFYDANGDGFFTSETEIAPATLSSGNYVCTGSMIVAVNKRYCNNVAGGLGKKCELDGFTASGLTSITQTAVDACRNDQTRFCPLQLDANSKPQCFSDSNGDKLYDAQIDGTLAPSISGAGTYTCPNTKPNIAVGIRCYVPCNNWCSPRNAQTECAIDCSQDGMRAQPVGSEYVEHGWSNTSTLVRLIMGYSADDEENYTKNTLRPYRLFPDKYYQGEASYSFSSAISTMDMPLNTDLFGSLNDANALRIDVAKSKGCGIAESEDKYSEADMHGIYELKQINNPDLGTGSDIWSGWLEVLEFRGHDDYAGAGGRNDNYVGSRCMKGGTDGAWSKDFELCGTVYPDWQDRTSGEACINSQFIFEDSEGKRGVWGVNVIRQPWENSTFLITSPAQYIMPQTGDSCMVSPAGYARCRGENGYTSFAVNNANDRDSVLPDGAVKDKEKCKEWLYGELQNGWKNSDIGTSGLCGDDAYAVPNDPLAPRDGDVCPINGATKLSFICEGGLWHGVGEVSPSPSP
ncbi:Carboxypeptidase regulatory-like domain protein [Candidatus Norongarragalina meridionalis]|nr:Carboxypeptidase regulatory-like domain protein [Candidatus Norongarragalina meridionalis]